MSDDPIGSGLGTLGGSSSTPAAGGATGAAVAAGAGAPAVNGGASAFGRLVRGVLPEHGHVSPSTGGEIDYLRTAWGSDHLSAPDPHVQYLSQAEADTLYLPADYTPPPVPPEYVDEAELATALSAYQALAARAQPNGYASLDAAGVVPTAQLPPLAVTDVYTVGSQAEMLALTAQRGDLCVRTDTGLTYVLAAEPAAVLANWKEVMAAGQVVSVNGQTGVVSLDAGDVGAYSTAEADAAFLTAPEADALFLTPAEGDAAYAAVDHTHPNTVVGEWYFAASTVIASDPGNGNARTDTGVLTTATTLSASRTNNDGYQQAVFTALDTDDVLYVQDKNDNTRWVRYRVTATPARNPTYSLIPVALVSSSGVAVALPQLCTVIFTVGAGGGGGGGGGAVTSVNGETGAVVLDAADVGALAPAALTAHTALPNAHHAQDHNHTAADGSGALSNEQHDGYSQYANLGADPSTPAANQIRLYAKDNGAGVATLYYRTEDGSIYELPTLSGGGSGSGAPSNAGYVTLAAEGKLSQEAVLGTAVVMSGLLAGRPAVGAAGRLYLGTDTDTVYRDTGSAWETFATRAAGGGSLPLTGGTLTGALRLDAATGATNVLNARASGEANPRFRVDASGKLEWVNPSTGAVKLALTDSGTSWAVTGSWVPNATTTYTLGTSAVLWNGVYSASFNTGTTGFLEVGSSAQASAGAVRLRNAATLAWRNAANGANLTVAMDASDRLALAVGTGTLTTSATGGSATAPPAQPVGYWTVVLNGTAAKIPYYA